MGLGNFWSLSIGKKGGNKPPATQSTISLNKLLSEFVSFLELASVFFGPLLLEILTRNRKLLQQQGWAWCYWYKASNRETEAGG